MMIQFLAPLGLFSLLALILPIAIHLLSRKPGKTIKVGSLQFLQFSESQQLKSLKLTDLPLLLIRAALMTTLALLLAKPFWQKKINASATPKTGWILVAPELINGTHDPQIDHHIDSLATIGNELHLFAPDFPSAQITSGKISHQEMAKNILPINYWSLLREIDRRAPAHIPLWIFVPDRLAFFQGERPTLQRPVHWLTFPEPRENHLIEKDGNPADSHFLLFSHFDSATVTILHDDQRHDEARYVQTALETIAEFNRMPISIQSRSANASAATTKYTGWLFWLSDQLVPSSLLQQAAQGLCLVSDAGLQKYERVASMMVMSNQAFEHLPRLERRVAPARQGVVLWTDGFGEPLLEDERIGKGRHYRFYSRFHPAWNELILHAAFPEWLFALINQRDDFTASPTGANQFSDQRRVCQAQAQPQTQAAATTTDSPLSATNLHAPLWILAAVLFGLERWWAERKTA